MDLRTYLDYPGGEDLKHSNSALKEVVVRRFSSRVEEDVTRRVQICPLSLHHHFLLLDLMHIVLCGSLNRGGMQ